MVRLEPMTPAEFDAWLAWSIPYYADAHVRSGRWRREDAVERSRAEHGHLLPKGRETPDHYFFTLHDERTNERVGELWFALQRQEGWPQLFIFWIGIDEAHRRRGHAASALAAVEAEAKRLGAVRVALHVFGDNAGARALYGRSGFVEADLVMAKAV